MIVAGSVFARRCAGLFGPFGCYGISAVFFADIVGYLRSCMILYNMPDSANSFDRERNSVHTICTLFPLNSARQKTLNLQKLLPALTSLICEASSLPAYLVFYMFPKQ
jgi:hypothetical protein